MYFLFLILKPGIALNITTLISCSTLIFVTAVTENPASQKYDIAKPCFKVIKI